MRKNEGLIVIEKIEAHKQKTVAMAMEKAQKKYDEALGSYRDTGWDRYYKAMDQAQEVMETLQKYIDQEKIIAEERGKLQQERQKCKEIVSVLKNKCFYILAEIPDCTEARSLKNYLDSLHDV